MRTKTLKYLAAWLLATLVFLSPVWGQTVTGSITGQVTDPSGAAIPGASVTAENVATSVKSVVKTNAAGVYSIRFLPSGTYTLTVEAKGFTSENIAAFPVEIAQTVKINIGLKIASVTRVVVNASAQPNLNTTSATLGNTLSTTEIANIPLNGRNFSSLTMFEPGAVATDPTGMTGNNAIERNTYNSGIASIDGNRQQANDYVLEGADDNEPQNNLIGYNPAPDAIAEVRVISSNGNATYGNTNGGTVVTILKSGTNKFHGSAYDFLEDWKLDANTWSNDLNGSPKSHYTQDIFGGTFGGPVKHDKLFFFGDYEGVRRNYAQPDSTASVLTPAMLKGDFSSLLPLGIQLYDPLNNDAPYPNNQVPVLNPVAKYLAAHPNVYPAPNRAPEPSTAIGNNYVGPVSSYIHNNQEDFKVDWTPTGTNRFSGFYSQGTGSDFTSAIIPVFFPSHSTYPTKIAGATFVHTFSPTLVNEFRAGFTRVRWNNGVPSDPSGLFGLHGDSIVGIPFGGQSYVGFSGQSISGGASYIGTNANPQVFTDNTFVYSDDLTWQRGRHLLMMGGQAIRYQQNFLNAGNVGFLGTFSYSGSFTANLNAANGPGYGAADFVLDRISNRQLASPLGNVGQRQWRLAGYFQDDFKMSPKLTLNLGLRYEFDQPWYEIDNRTANVLPGGTVEYAGHVPAGAVAGSVVCPTRACYNANYTQFMPRVGFAYQLSPKFVVRGGFAGTSFFEGYSFNQRLTSSPPFTLAINQPAVLPSTSSGGVPFTVEEGFGGDYGANPNYNLYSIWPQDTQPAYIYEYNLTTEYAFTNNLSLSVGYVGQNGFDLADYYNGNQLTLAEAQAVSTLGCGATFPASEQSPYYALVGECGTTLVTESDARMNYNAAQVTLRQRTQYGLDFTINYTYAKSLTDSSGNYTVSGTSWNGSTFENAYDKMADWGPSAMDIRHSLNLVAVYELPFGQGRTFGQNASRLVDAAFGGWRLSASAIVYSGFPVTIFGPDNSNSLGVFGFSRANQYRPLKIVNRTINNWWGTDPSAQPCITAGVDNGTCAYGAAGSFTFGDAANSTERGPGYQQLDTSLFKNFKIRENQTLSFRADFFNVLNVPSYGNPGNTINSTGFGLINSVRSPPRQIQFSLDYQF